jgi:hypothetical protein
MRANSILLTVAVALAAATAGAALAAGSLSATYLYALSDFSGPVSYEQPILAADPARSELFVAESDTVRVFGPSGMLVHEFEHDRERLGPLIDLACLPSGDVLILSRAPQRVPGDVRGLLTRATYRGEPRTTTEIQGLPAAFAGFFPEVVRARGERLYLASLSERRVVATDLDGRFIEGWDLLAAFGTPAKQRGDMELAGFDVDRAGNFLVTAPLVGQGYRIGQRGGVTAFGDPGSGPGSLGIARGIVATDGGLVVVADLLNRRLVVFDADLGFVTELPAGPRAPELFVGPVALAANPGGRVYVGEIGQRPISVFELNVR